MEKHILQIIANQHTLIELSRAYLEQSQCILQLLQPLAGESDLDLPSVEEDGSSGVSPKDSYAPEELMTVDQACRALKISRWKLTDMRDKGELTSIRNGRSVRLIREEVEAAKLWYSVPKGKI